MKTASKIDTTTVRNRPRFKVKTKKSNEKISLAFRRVYALHKKVLSLSTQGDSMIFSFKSSVDKFYAPQLQVRWEKDDDDFSLYIIRGLFSPKPAIWTFFMFLYFLGFTVFGFFGAFWFVQQKIDLSSDLSLWAWVGLFILVLTYSASTIGKYLAKKETKYLRNFAERALEELNEL